MIVLVVISHPAAGAMRNDNTLILPQPKISPCGRNDRILNSDKGARKKYAGLEFTKKYKNFLLVRFFYA
jgi:hypothetical protein